MHGPGGAPNKGWLTDFRETIGSRENSHETSMVDGGMVMVSTFQR